MKIMTSIILTTMLFLQLGTSCKKEPIIEPICNDNKTDTTTLNQDFSLIWSVSDNRGFSCYGTIVTTNSVIYFIDPPGTGGDDIISLDKITGDTLWIKQAQGSTSKHKLLGNSICFDSKGLTNINVSSGNQNWKISNSSSKRLEDFIVSNNKIYAFFSLGTGIVGDSTKLYEINPSNGIAIEKHTLYGRDRNGYNQSPTGIVYYLHPNGNEIIFTQASGYKPSITTSIGQYYAIDITNDSIYWDLGNHFNITGLGSRPIIKHNTIIINGPWGQHSSLNIETKAINWNTQVSTAYRTSGGYITESGGKIFQSVGNSAQFNIINSNDGSFYKNYGNLGYDSFGSNFIKYNSHIYFTTTKGLFKMNSSGTIVKQVLATEALADAVGGSFSNGLDIDPITGNIYTTCGFNLVCIKEK